ncbi:unnamed protein product [Cladocopium goreaui]|uniref:Sugar phosphate/phosphate translocator n=1 Tax=Cladocopium goreaui TaxID=2562237 RepID=A0A9P1C0P2_9DINO|nr:unnamed protein product [Cladocopium goreaui]
MASTWKIVGALACTISMSATMIIFNASLLQGFRHPVWLTFWHQSVSTACVVLVRCLKPSLVSTGDEAEGRPALTFFSALRLGFPIAATQCLGLIAGNTAVMYLSVGFCQMIKAWTASAVYVVGCFCGLQHWSIAVAKTLLLITFGLMVTSAGEVKFDPYGFLMQVTALFSEACRINLVEIRLKSAGYKLNPLSSVMLTAPIASVLLLIIGLVTDGDAITPEVIQEVGEVKLLANGLVAFLLNVAIFLAIQVCSGLVYSLAGIVKDISIISGSVLILGSQVSMMQVLGYSIALGGIQIYGIVSREPSRFQDSGLVRGLWQHMRNPAAHMVAPEGVGMEKSKLETDSADLELGKMGDVTGDTTGSIRDSRERHALVATKDECD